MLLGAIKKIIHILCIRQNDSPHTMADLFLFLNSAIINGRKRRAETGMAYEVEELIAFLKATNEDQTSQIKEQEATIADLRITIAELRTTVANLNDTLDGFRRKFSGTSSEKAWTTVDEALDIVEADEAAETTKVKGHARTRDAKSVRDDLYAILPVREVVCPALIHI